MRPRGLGPPVASTQRGARVFDLAREETGAGPACTPQLACSRLTSVIAMPFALVVADDDSRTGDDLRRHRGRHDLYGTGPCLRLATLLPGLVALAAGDRTIVPFIVALWLVLPCLRLEKAAMAEFIFNQMVAGLRAPRGGSRFAAGSSRCRTSIASICASSSAARCRSRAARKGRGS